jgi:hypothetical protein
MRGRWGRSAGVCNQIVHDNYHPSIRRRSVTFASTDLALGQTVRKANRSLGYFLYDLEGMQS